jgi:hypothetical protein
MIVERKDAAALLAMKAMCSQEACQTGFSGLNSFKYKRPAQYGKDAFESNTVCSEHLSMSEVTA